MNRNSMLMHGPYDLSCPLHANVDLEIVYVRSGKMLVFYEDTEYSLADSQAMVIMPCRMHEFDITDGTDARVFMFSYYLANESLGNMTYLNAENNVFNVSPALKVYIDGIIDSLDSETVIDNSFLVQSIYYSFMNDYLTKNRLISCKKDSIVQRAIDYISSEEDEHLKIEEIAKALGVSRRVLSDTFVTQTGIRIGDFIKNTRLERATDLLSRTTLDVTEIAYRCGYGSVRNFNRDFKRVFECTPSDYRRHDVRLKEGNNVPGTELSKDAEPNEIKEQEE